MSYVSFVLFGVGVGIILVITLLWIFTGTHKLRGVYYNKLPNRRADGVSQGRSSSVIDSSSLQAEKVFSIKNKKGFEGEDSLKVLGALSLSLVLIGCGFFVEISKFNLWGI